MSGILMMRTDKRRTPNRHGRNNDGAQMPEFAAALVLLVMVFFIPALDLAIIPIRFFMTREVIEQTVRELSHADKLSHAFAEVYAEPGLHERIKKIGGVEPKNIEAHLIIQSDKDLKRVLDVTKPKTIPQDWWPDSKLGPYIYRFEVIASLEISPAVLCQFDPKITGISSPIPAQLSLSSPWEHLARNPVTKAFYINE
jgi:hypothetical protein